MRVVFVCWGNICRSPMAERVARSWAERDGVDATFTSAGVSSEGSGNPIDRRAAAVLTRAGYDAGGHRAHRITADEIEQADLVVAAEPMHLTRLRRLVPDAEHLRLLNDYNLAARPVVRRPRRLRRDPRCRRGRVARPVRRDRRPVACVSLTCPTHR